jgi:radical SAM protein with 4Fe4S-binding SPASM domain
MITNKYPLLSKRAFIREEAEGGVFVSGSGPFKMITSQDLDALRRIDGRRTAYDIARSMSNDETELACTLIRLFDMAGENIVQLQDEASCKPRPVVLSEHHPFSVDAFSSPVLVSLGVTSECNRNCTHCYRAGFHSGNALGDSELAAVIEQVAELNIAELNITGGEPLLRSNITKLVSFASSMINSVTVSTNGTLIDENALLELGKAGLKRIQVGVNVVFDSPDSRTADEDRKQIAGALGEAARSGIDVIIGAVLTRNLIQNLESVFAIADAIGAKAVRFGPLLSCHGSLSAGSISSSDVVAAVLGANKLGEERGISAVFGDGLTASSNAPGGLADRRRYCYLGTGNLHIESDGSIYPCSALLAPEFRVGSVGHRSTHRDLMSIWRNSDVLRNLRNLTTDRLTSCTCCEIKARCGGGCRTAAYWSTGDIAGASPYCEMNKELWRAGCM